jgi:hypothetical protein
MGEHQELALAILVAAAMVVSTLLLLILFKLSRLVQGVSDLNIKIGRIGIRQITSAVHYEDGTMKVSTDTTPEVNEIIRLLRDIQDTSKLR